MDVWVSPSICIPSIHSLKLHRVLHLKAGADFHPAAHILH